MTLSALIRKGGLEELATMTPATPATLEGKNGPTVAVADPSELEMDSRLSAEEELKIRKWFTAINETDKNLIDELISNCRTNPKHREYFLRRSDEPMPIVVHTGNES